MLYNYLKIALRNLLRHKSFSIINMAGLAIGLTTFLAISLYVVDEFSFDRFHEKQERIYRAVLSAEFDGQSVKWGGAPNLLAPTAMKEIPEVEKATRYFHHNFGDLAFIGTDEEKFTETNLFFADPELFDIFTIPLLKGNPSKIIDRPNTVVISESAAKKYFGDSDPIGKTLTVDNNLTLEVTGIYSDFPSNSFLQADLIASFSSNWFGLERNQSWGNASFDTFFLLHQGVSKNALDEKIEAMLAKNIATDDRWFKINSQPLAEIRLHSSDLKADFDRRQYGDFKQVKILMALALIIIVIAAVNYMNLTTAQSQRRHKEVGISKTLGATFYQLNRKFYAETSVFVLVAMLLSLTSFMFLLPVYNELSGKSIGMQFITTTWFWVGFATVWLVLTVLSGFYPAIYLSSFSPKSALSKTAAAGAQSGIRKGLVVFQFAISIVLIICAAVFQQQMSFIQNKKLGYQPEQVIAVMTTASKEKDQLESLKSSFESLADVVSVAKTQSYPGIGTSMRSLHRPGETEQGTSLLTTRATHEILDVLDIKLLAGKSLPATPKDPRDTVTQVVVNKAAVDYLGLSPEEAIGRTYQMDLSGPCEIVGVMEDFHVASLHQKIGAFCFHNGTRTEPFNYLLVKANTSNLAGTVKQLENTYKKVVPAAFEYKFLDQHLASLYAAEQNLSKVVMLFAGLAIFVACLGLYALAAFTAEQRSKEIGIRKVMGASVPQLVNILSRDFILLVLIAFVIGIPAAYYLMNQWLDSFAYRTNISVTVFIIAGLVSLVIAWLTVSFESLKAANANPVKSLRSE
ncbi:MAG: ABC transporter permease [Cyclobacteriaceae bacterium]|nr:ABC transporter permease [Cyclobacteriaceae bacterium]